MTKEICMFLLVHHLMYARYLTGYLNHRARSHALSWKNMQASGCLILTRKIKQLRMDNALRPASGVLLRLRGILLTRTSTLFSTVVMICTEHGRQNIPNGKVHYYRQKNS